MKKVVFEPQFQSVMEIGYYERDKLRPRKRGSFIQKSETEKYVSFLTAITEKSELQDLKLKITITDERKFTYTLQKRPMQTYRSPVNSRCEK